MTNARDTKKGTSLHQLLLSMFLLSMGVLLVFLYVTLVPRVTDLLKSNAVDRTRETVLQSVKSLDIFVDNMLAALNYSATLLPVDLAQADTQWRHQLTFVAKSRDAITDIAFFAGDGTLLFSTRDSAAPPPGDIRRMPFFQYALDRQGAAAYFSPPHVQHLFGEARTDVVTLSRAAEYVRGGVSDTGVMLMDVDYKALSALISGVSLGESGYAYLLDEYDALLCHPFEQQIFSELLSEDVTAIRRQLLGITTDTVGDKERVLIIETVNKTRWRMVGVAYIDEIATLENAFVRSISVVMICGALLAFAAATLMAHFVARPITAVETTMKQVIQGDMNVTISVSGFREIRSVASAFNHMLSRIRALMRQIVAEQEKKRLHELNALQAQINPHFLYNTLDSIIWMEERGRGREAIPMVAALARLFRISISKGRSIIKVSEELEHVRNYLIIQKMRFKDMFFYTIEATEEALAEHTLKLIVQPIVENCINHAIDQTQSQELHIDIRAFTDGDRLCFTIRDDGVGISPERMATLLTHSAGTSGIGLKNVHERIVLTYGAGYGITIDSVEDQYTLVTIALPRGKEEPA